jgi:predicted ATPase
VKDTAAGIKMLADIAKNERLSVSGARMAAYRQQVREIEDEALRAGPIDVDVIERIARRVSGDWLVNEDHAEAFVQFAVNAAKEYNAREPR